MKQGAMRAAPAGDQPVPSAAVVRRRLTRFARLPERIALCIDVSPEMGQPWSASSPLPTRLDVLKQALTVFLHIKSLLNPRHEFSLVTVDEQESRVVLPFSVALPEIYRTLSNITPVGTWPPAAPAADAVTDPIGATPTANGINLSHLLGNTLPSLLSKYLTHNRDSSYDNPGTPSSSSSQPALARAILFMGTSYALPLLPQPSVVQALFANDSFFFDMMYLHARKASPPVPLTPPPPSSSTTTDVVLVDLADDQDDVAVVQAPAAAQALPPSILPPRIRRSAEIWNACLDLLVDHHPFLPESSYCFSVLHGSSTDRVLTPLQLLLAHPAHRLPQSMAEERLHYHHPEPEAQEGGEGGRGKGGWRMRMMNETREGKEEMELGARGGSMEGATPVTRGEMSARETLPLLSDAQT